MVLQSWMAAVLMLDDLGDTQRITLGADKGYDRREFVQALRDKNVTPQCGQEPKGFCHQWPHDPPWGLGHEHPRSPSRQVDLWLDEDHRWYAENPFPWLGRVGLHFSIAATAYDILPIARLGVV